MSVHDRWNTQEANKDFTNKAEAQKKYNTNDWFNKTTLAKKFITKASDCFRKANPEVRLTHILDREFDTTDYFKHVDMLGDKFVIRAKKSRILSISSKEKKKLIDADFENSDTRIIQKLSLKGKYYQDAKVKIEWLPYEGYFAVRITLFDREGNALFKNPMLLITNISVATRDDAAFVYQLYLKRPRIEAVFKFLKEGMGWEEIQMRNFKAIQNLLSVCFFIAAYLYEIGQEQASDDFVILLAQIGGGKGKVTRHYILQGIKDIMSKYRVDRIMNANNPPQNTIDSMLAVAGKIV